MWLEDPRQDGGCNAGSIVDSFDRHPSFFLTYGDVDATRTRKPGVLENIEQYIPHLVFSRLDPGRSVSATQLPLHLSITHLLEFDDILHNSGDIHIDCRRQIGGCAAVSAE